MQLLSALVRAEAKAPTTALPAAAPRELLDELVAGGQGDIVSRLQGALQRCGVDIGAVTADEWKTAGATIKVQAATTESRL